MYNLTRFAEEVEQEALEAQVRLEAKRREALARIRREEAEADALLGRLRRDYEVDLARCLVSGRYEAFAWVEGRTVGYGWGASRLEALRALAGDLGLVVRDEA
ncbi:hypothetical protein KZX47_13560 [Thermus sp. SYSU G05001]|uniref:Uncharacterized protein n=1 Tax=Thermus brevis TaxID=2862456 RepID=A0ABS7A324_9DEIN|nr:hypothetical protein [Thermus brevis]MBW6396167.1 hypothetical protein [Thermus brevis]